MSSTTLSRSHRAVVVTLVCLAVGAVLFAGGAAADEATGTIEGTVENEAGEPIEGINVTVNGTFDEYGFDITSEDGTYEIESIEFDANETYDLELTDTNGKYEDRTREEVEFSTTDSPVTENFLAEDDNALDRKTGTISGTVSTEFDGVTDGVFDATVTIEYADDADQTLIEEVDDFDETVKTDDDGDYEFASIPNSSGSSNTIELTVAQDGYSTNDSEEVADLSPDDEIEQNIELDLITGEIEGTVTNTDGDAITNASVEITDDTAIWPSNLPVSNSTDSDGSYLLEAVPITGGTNNASVRTLETDPPTFERDTIDASTGDTDADFELIQDTTGELDGTVTDAADGTPLEGIEITVDVAGVDATATTDANGEYEIQDIPFGTHDVTASHQEYDDNTQTDIEITESETLDFEMTRQTDVALSIDDVTPTLVQSGDEVTITYTFNEDVTDEVEYETTGRGDVIDGPETLTPSGQETRTVEIPDRDDIEDGTYTVRFEALGTTATESFIVSNALNPEEVGELDQPLYETPAGDFVEINTGGEYMLIGGDSEDDGSTQQYFDILHVEDGTTVINTRLIGTNTTDIDRSPYDDGVTSYAHEIGPDADQDDREGTVFEDVAFEDENGNEVAESLAEFREEIGISERSAPLQADRYRLVAGENGRVMIRDDDVADFRRPAGRSNIDLTYTHELGDVTTYVLPPGSADEHEDDIGSYLEDATESRTVTHGERILVEVPAVGMWGSVADLDADDPLTADDINTLLENHEGVHIDFSIERYGHPNSRSAELKFDDVAESDLNVLLDETDDQWDDDILGDDPLIGGFYLVIDTRGSDPFTNQPQHEDDLRFDMEYQSPDGERYQYQDYSLIHGEKPDPFSPAVSAQDGVEHFPYFGSSDTTVAANSSNIEFLDIDIRYDQTLPDDDLIVPAQEDGRIVGSTTMAPGSTATIQLISSDRPNPELITIEEVTVDEDRRFDVEADFSDLEPGQRVEVEFYAENRLLDNRIVDKRGVHVVEDLENPATFEIANLTDSVEVEQRESLGEIQTTITNTGDIVDRQTVKIRVDGETIKEESVLLSSGESTTLDLSDRFVTLPVGEYEYTVETDNDEATGELIVNPPDSGTEITSADSDAATSESPLGDDELPGDDTDDGLFAFVGVTSRDVAVATAVAGVVHVLGSFT